jgi:predicted aspartyl protease
MAQDSTGFIAALKQVWLSNVIEDQIYQGNPLMDALERVKPQGEVGNVALVSVHTGRSGAYSAVPRTGSNELNAAKKQEVKKAEYNYTHHWFQVELETAVIDESSKSDLAVAQAVEVEMKGAVNDIRKQLTRQAFMDGSALMAKTGTVAGSTTIPLAATGFGPDALKRGWIYPTLEVDIGTKANQVAVAGPREITGVNKKENKITISGANVSTEEANHWISIHNARSGETSNEMSGLLQLVAETGVVGNINPESVPLWASPVDSTEQELSLEALYERQDAVFQETGEEPDWALTSSKQYRLLYQQLQAQVRFNGDGGLQAGDKEGLKLGKTLVERQPDCPDRCFWLLTKSDLIAIRGEGPQWADEKYGGTSQPVQYVSGTTKVKGALVYRMQVGLKQRNSHSGLTALK